LGAEVFARLAGLRKKRLLQATEKSQEKNVLCIGS